MSAEHLARLVSFNSLSNPLREGDVTVRTTKMRFREVRCLPNGHTASKKTVDLNPDTFLSGLLGLIF